MPRGEKAEIGAEVPTPQGYVTVKTEDGWKLKHRLVMEQKLGRPLGANERVCFHDRNKTNCNPKNLYVIEAKDKKLRELYERRERLRVELNTVTEKIQTIESILDGEHLPHQTI